MTPLHYASAVGAVEAGRLLLAAGADVNAVDWRNKTPLHVAAAADRVDIVLLLLGPKRAKLDARSNYGDDPPGVLPSATPIHLAALTGSTNAVRKLLSANAVSRSHVQPF